MTGPVEEYLRQLRASLRTPPQETSRILAEAEDHLRESVAAGLAAGLTETEAAEAAISSFGSVRAVVRAHQTRRGRTVAALSGLAMTTWLLAGTVLMSVFAVGLVMVVVILAAGPPNAGNSDPDPAPGQLAYLILACGALGLAVLASYFSRPRRFLQRGSGRG
jgi:HAAS domain-containing protein